MDKYSWKQYKPYLLVLAVIVSMICLIALAFFRTDIFIRGLRTIVSILKPFTYGFVIAFLLRPVCLRIEALLQRLTKDTSGRRHGLFRGIATAISLILLLLGLCWVILTILPQIVSSLSSIVSSLPGAVQHFQEWLSELDNGEASHELVTYINDITNTLSQKLESFLETSLLPTMQTAIAEITSSFMDLAVFIKDFGLGYIISAYFLVSWEKFFMQAKLLVYSIFPQKAADWIRNETHFVSQVFSGFIVGKIVDSFIVGVICFVFCAITQMPYALLVSVLIGVTNVIPFFGPYLGVIPSVLLILTVSLPKAIIFLVFIIILQQVDGNVLGPKILGDRLGISSFWILFSILFFGSLWGLVGMLIGVPLFAVIYDLLRRMVFKGLEQKNCQDLKDQYMETYHKS